MTKRGDIVAVRVNEYKLGERFCLLRVVGAKRKTGEVTHVTRPTLWPIPPAGPANSIRNIPNVIEALPITLKQEIQIPMDGYYRTWASIEGMCEWLSRNIAEWSDDDECRCKDLISKDLSYDEGQG